LCQPVIDALHQGREIAGVDGRAADDNIGKLIAGVDELLDFITGSEEQQLADLFPAIGNQVIGWLVIMKGAVE
jgi:hypothetical protein